MGWGAAALRACLPLLLAYGLARRGFCKGDVFVAGSLLLVVGLIALFVFYPVLCILASAVRDNDGGFAPGCSSTKLLSPSIWSLGCLTGAHGCGVAWNTVAVATLVGVLTTLLGLAFALVALRTRMPMKPLLRALSILPIITPPFVIGLALILLFGRAGMVTMWIGNLFDIPRSRWIYGMPGITIAQVLAFTPIAMLVLLGVLQGVGAKPGGSVADAARRALVHLPHRHLAADPSRPRQRVPDRLHREHGRLRQSAGDRRQLQRAVHRHLLRRGRRLARPGPRRGAGHRAAGLHADRLRRRSASGSAGAATRPSPARATPASPHRCPAVCASPATRVIVPWLLLTVAVYGMILIGGFVVSVGRDNTPTLEYFWTAFSIEKGVGGWFLSGSAWNSFIVTIEIALIAMPFTAALGILTAWLLDRQQFPGRRTFEFLAMMSFAIPGTVIGVGYILAFNVPPVSLTGTGTIIAIGFVFRNMPVGIRAGLANLSQIDRSLDEASLTLGARSFGTLRRVILPMLRPAIVTAMVYSFVRAVTAVSAVIFLVTGRLQPRHGLYRRARRCRRIRRSPSSIPPCWCCS